ncbi:Serine/threonine-protein kinase Pkn1 [Stieleria maiorica]|uniref:Serine/threonine-protein kinase Pkn1 n=1 Tax=Stieleria maiorica TaxID=2795974 RepID=A0A5B9MCY9_9BACT|nr:protein kinase [Stieleria maiorica]QEF98653.1 Serine/threonine-protein kinase Pkn1 [Stieleria maiorica]
MSNAPPVEFHPGMEVVPGYTLISPLGSGMAGDVWQAQAAGGIKVALKVVRNLKDLGGRKELKALKTIRDVHHPNLCPLFGFWTKDADGRVLADGETEDLTLDSISGVGLGVGPGQKPSGQKPSSQSGHGPPEPPSPDAPSDHAVEMGGTMAIGSGMPYSPPAAESPAETPVQAEPAKPKVTAEQLIVVMGLGDCTLYDRLKFVRQDAGLGPDAYDTPYGLDAAEAVRYLRAAASAIDLLNQEHQIYHCDIKPQNILLVGGEAQVCDFGLAKQMEGDMRQTQQAFATPAYAPPEVLHNEGYSRQVDQYSLAVTYYELRTGLLPFDITTHASMLVAKSTGKLNLDALTPPERKVLQKALRRVPSERYGSCTEFVNAIAVASGVEKSGGITIGRIITAVAVLLVTVGLGIGVWSVAHPESFKEFFFRSEIEVAKDLDDERTNYERTEPLLFDESHVTLTQVMSHSAEIAQQSEGELKDKADALFADAATRLIGKIHTALKQYESRPGAVVAQKESKSLAGCLSRLALEPAGPDNAILGGLESWMGTNDDQLQNACHEYLSLYHAAVVRFDLLLDSNPTVEPREPFHGALPEHLDALRRSLDDRPGDFSQGSIDLTLASLLPVLATMPAEEIKTWTAEQWLDETRLGDLIRAELVVRQFGPHALYARRWAEIRETFTLAVEPAVTGTATTAGVILPATRQRVLDGFPDLRTEKQIAELRTAVQQSLWGEVERLLGQLRGASSINPEQTTVLAVVDAMAKHRAADNALELTLTSIKQAGIAPTQLRHLRMQPLLASYLREIGRRIIADPDGRSTRLFTQLSSARWVQDELQMPVPEEFVAAAAISLLRESPELISDSAGQAEWGLDLDAWLKRLDESAESAELSAAIRIEREIAAGSANPSAVSAATEVLRSSDHTYLGVISKDYADYLLACGACLQNQDIGPVADKLATTSRESIQALGQTRLYLGTDMLVRHAIASSGIADDEVVSLRYSQGSVNASDLSRSRSYLKLAETLARSTGQGFPTALEGELFLLTVASGGSQAGQIVVPRLIRERLETPETTADLSTQTLKALHLIGIEMQKAAGDPRERHDIALRFLLRPARALLERFGRDRFGPRTGDSNAKGVLIRMVLLPTVRDVVYEAMRFIDGQLLPIGFQKDFPWPVDEVNKLCQVSAVAYRDPMTRTEFQDQDFFRRQRVAISAIAAQDASLSQAETRAFLTDVAMAAVSIRSCDGQQLLTLADKLARSGRATDVIQFVRSEGLERLANVSETRAQRGVFLKQAFEATEAALAATPGDTDQTDQAQLLYEISTKSADLGVRLAFLQQPISDKLSYLKPSLSRADRALELYLDQWAEEVHCPIVSAYITKGNVCEDIAHYCSIGDDEVSIQQREEHFRLAIAAFKQAKNKNDQDLKTRFSLGRCEYRWAITLEGSAKDAVLADASRSLGDPPQSLDNLGEVEANKAAEWYVWKINVQWERDNQNDALQLAIDAVQLVRDRLVHINIRSDLARKCAWVMAKSGRLNEAVTCLRVLDGEGEVSDVILRMGLLSDIAFFGSNPDKALFTVPLRILERVEKLRTLADDDDATYELAKIATRSVREQLANRIRGVQPKTSSTPEDLSIGPQELDAQLDHQTDGRYLELSRVFLQGDAAARSGDADAIFRFTCDLASVADSIPDPPFYVEDSDYITDNLCLMVLYCLNYWVDELAQKDALDKKQMQERARDELTAEKHADVVQCLDSLKQKFLKAQNTRLARVVDDAIGMVDDLVEREPELPGA